MKKCLILFVFLFVLLFSLNVNATVKYYNFSGITSPSSTHIAWYGNTSSYSSSPSNDTTPGDENEFGTGGGSGLNKYVNISLSDNNYAYHNESAQQNYSAYHKFLFSLSETSSSINRLNLTWEGHPGGVGGAEFFVWNHTISGWNLIGSTSSANDVNISASFLSNLNDYVNDSNDVVLLIFNEYTNPYAEFYTDFVQVVMDGTVDSTSPNVTLTNPPNQHNQTSNSTFVLGCSVVEETGLQNLTLFTNTTGTWKANQTIVVTGLSNATNFTIEGVKNGTWKWNCKACDTSNNCAFNETNFTFSLNKLVITNVMVYSGLFAFSITWDTNINANSSLNYTNSSGYVYKATYTPQTLIHGWGGIGEARTTWPETYGINITSCTLAGECVSSLGHSATVTGDSLLSISQINVTLISPVNSSNVTSKNNTFSFNASSSPFRLTNASIYINESGTFKSNYTIKINGTFNSSSFYLNNSKDGKFKWNVYVCDYDRQCNWSRNNWTFTVDTSNPVINASYPINSSELTFESGQINFTFNVTDNTTGIANCSLWLSAVNVSTLTRNATDTSITEDQNQTFNITKFKNGEYKWLIECVDHTNNKGNSTINNFTLGGADVVLPSKIELIIPQNAYNVSNSSIIFNISANNDNLKNISIFTNLSGVWKINQTRSKSGTSNSSNFTITNIKDGTYLWGGRVCDVAGNCNVSVNRTFTVDTVAPNVSLVYPVNSSEFAIPSGQVNFTFNVSDNVIGVNNCSLWLSAVNNTVLVKNISDTSISENVNQSFNVTGMGGGNYRWLVECKDVVNNGKNSTIGNFSMTITVDAIVPTLVNLISPGNYLNSSNNSITFNVSADNDNLVNISIFLNTSGSWKRNLTIGRTGTSNSSNFTITNIKDGTYLWGGHACDSYGNCNVSVNRTFTVDTVAPNLSAVSISKDCDSATLTWSTNENSNSSLEYGKTVGLGTISNSGSLVSSHSLGASGLEPGTRYYFNVSSCDSSSNCNTSSGSFLTSTGCGGGGGGGGDDPDDPDDPPEPCDDCDPEPCVGDDCVIPPPPPPLPPGIQEIATGFFGKEFFNKTKVEVSSEYKCGGIVLSLGELADIQLNLEEKGRFVIPKLFFNFGEKREYCAWCYDGVKNYDEEEIDCGGSCGSCEDVKSCYSKLPVGIIVLLFILLFVNGMYLINEYDKKKLKFGGLLIGIIIVLSIIFSKIYTCYSYGWVIALLILFIVFYVLVCTEEKDWRKIIKRKGTKYDDLYNYNNLKEEFDKLVEVIEKGVRNGRVEKGKFGELLVVYNKLLKYLEYREKVNVYHKLVKLRSKLEMKELLVRSKSKVKKYKREKIGRKEIKKKRKIDLTVLGNHIGKFKRYFRKDKELEKLKKIVYRK